MGLSIQATITCDKDLVNLVQIPDIYGPLPEGWVKVQGYVDSNPIEGFFCPVCVAQYGLNALSKSAVDLTIPQQPK